jgi:XRE family aerobic/anaerobic benzoate catabolism transcriptional regulator
MNNIPAFDRHLHLYAQAAPISEEEFIKIVGERVRMARARKSISRKALADSSRVSQRYLAQLEGGEGNISIALLSRIARALDHRIEWLVGEDDPWSSDVVRMASLYRVATSDQKRRVMGVLDPDNSSLQRGRRIALIGLRGAGKSSLGRLAAERLSVPFEELNAEIESSSGLAVNELIALYGQEGYRKLEREAVERIAATHDVLIMAAAGGIVSEPETFNYLLRNYHTVWLKAKPEEHMARVRKQGDTRPMAGNPAAMDELRSILTSRESLYARAEVLIDTSGKTVEQSLADLLAAIDREGFLK